MRIILQLIFIAIISSEAFALPPISNIFQKPSDEMINDSTSIQDYLLNNFDTILTPINGKVISPFGKRGQRFHTGTDIKLNLGDTIKSTMNGVVTKASVYGGYGNLVIIDHGADISTYYGHLSKILVNVNDTIKAGTPIGLGGRTGRATTNHLHFELRYNKVAYNAQKAFKFDCNIPSLAPVSDTISNISITNP